MNEEDIMKLLQQQIDAKAQALQQTPENGGSFSDRLRDNHAAYEQAKSDMSGAKSKMAELEKITRQREAANVLGQNGPRISAESIAGAIGNFTAQKQNYLDSFNKRLESAKALSEGSSTGTDELMQAINNKAAYEDYLNGKGQSMQINPDTGKLEMVKGESKEMTMEDYKKLSALEQQKIMNLNIDAMEKGMIPPYPFLIESDPVLGKNIEDLSLDEIKVMAGSDAQAILKRMFGNGIDKALGGQQAAKNKTAKDILIRMKKGEDVSSVMTFSGTPGTIISENQRLYSWLSELKQLMVDLDGKATGIGNVTMGNLAAVGNKANPKFVEYRSKLIDIRNYLLKDMSGAAISPEEAKRLEKMLPGGLFDSDQKAMAAVDEMINFTILNAGARMKAQGVDLNAEKYFKYGSGTQALNGSTSQNTPTNITNNKGQSISDFDN